MARKKASPPPTARKGRRVAPRGPTPPDAHKSILEYITPEFVERGARKMRREDLHYVVERGAAVRARFEKGQLLDRFRHDAELLIGLLEDHASGEYPEAPYWSLAVATFGLQYLLKPVDIIPDTLPVIGELDDAVVLSRCIAMLRESLYAYHVWRLAGEATIE